jgi:hypothetical protein
MAMMTLRVVQLLAGPCVKTGRSQKIRLSLLVAEAIRLATMAIPRSTSMLGLFDQPDAAFYEAYGLLEPGHDERTAIYRLWPALVHLRLFGAGYRPMVERLLQATGT